MINHLRVNYSKKQTLKRKLNVTSVFILSFVCVACTVLCVIRYGVEINTISFLPLNKPSDKGNIYRISERQNGIYRRHRRTRREMRPYKTDLTDGPVTLRLSSQTRSYCLTDAILRTTILIKYEPQLRRLEAGLSLRCLGFNSRSLHARLADEIASMYLPGYVV
jgi:hypothetical protein